MPEGSCAWYDVYASKGSRIRIRSVWSFSNKNKRCKKKLITAQLLIGMAFFRALQQQFASGITRQNQQLWRNQKLNHAAERLKTTRLQQKAYLHQNSHVAHRLFTTWRAAFSRRTRNVRWQSSKPSPNPTENLGSPEPQSLSARMRKLSREYGWSALGVYLGLSALDFPFCFLAVRWLGTDRIGRWEHAVVEAFWHAVELVSPDMRPKKASSEAEASSEGSGWGVEEADARNKSDSASKIWPIRP